MWVDLSEHKWLILAERRGANRISGIFAGQRAITAETALRLARYFNTTPDYWINMQTQYDLETARDEWEAKVHAQVQPRHAA